MHNVKLIFNNLNLVPNLYFSKPRNVHVCICVSLCVEIRIELIPCLRRTLIDIISSKMTIKVGEVK